MCFKLNLTNKFGQIAGPLVRQLMTVRQNSIYSLQGIEFANGK